MNSKSLLFIFALLALFSVSSAKVVVDSEQSEESEVDSYELISDTLSLMQKLLKSKEQREKKKITESLKTDGKNLVADDEIDVGPIDDLGPIEDEQVDEIEVEEPANEEQDNEEPVEQEPPVDLEPPSDEKYMVAMEDGNNQENNEDVEVITVTVEIEEGADVNVELDQAQPEINTDINNKNVIVADIDENAENVEGEAQNDDVQVDDVEEIVQNPDALGQVEYDVDINAVDAPKEQVKYYNVEEAEYNADEDAYETVVTSVEGDEKNGKGGIIGASVAVVGAFGVIGALGYKYTQRKKRVLLPFHEDLLEKDGFYDNAEQDIIPVWAGTCKKEENEEEKEEEDKLFEVVYNYEPELPDELKLTVGDKIMIKEIYEDGWAYGYNKTTQLFGTFPSTSLGEDFNPESVPQYKPEEVAVEMNDNMVEELKKKIVESN